jgi:transcriptional regulator with XRE-family HTH domain
MLQCQVNHASADRPLSFAPMETMGERIRILREAKGWTQDELAARLTMRGAPVTGNAVSQWERTETKNIRLATFMALVDELGTTHSYLIQGPPEAGRDSSGRYRKLRPRDDSDGKL